MMTGPLFPLGIPTSRHVTPTPEECDLLTRFYGPEPGDAAIPRMVELAQQVEGILAALTAAGIDTTPHEGESDGARAVRGVEMLAWNYGSAVWRYKNETDEGL